jgi:tRNA(fMet)-specific endonuclease VapC
MRTPRIYLPDTNILIAYFERDSSIRRHLAGTPLLISAVVAAELFYGAFNSDNRAENLDAFRSFLDTQHILPCNYVTAERYGIIAAELEQRGTRIKQNDVWLAAHALQHGLTVASRDAHFEPVVPLGLRLEVW